MTSSNGAEPAVPPGSDAVPSWLTEGTGAAWAVAGSPATAGQSSGPAAGPPPVESPESPENPLTPSSGSVSARAVSGTIWNDDRTAAPGALDPSGQGDPGPGFSDGFGDVVRARRVVPQRGWRAVVHAVTVGRWNPGLSAAEVRRRDQVRRIATPLPAPRSIATGAIKGGVGKTTVTAVLGLTMAEYRGDRVIAIDANPDAGTLGDRLVGEVQAGKTTVRDLLRDLDRIQSSTQLAGYTHLAGRLRVVTSEQEPALSEMFSAGDYEAVLRLLAAYHEVLLTDCGTGLVHSAMQGTLEHADSLVVVGAPTKDGASRASRTLQWLATHHDPDSAGDGYPYRDLVANAVVVLSHDRSSPDVDAAAIRDWFAARVRAVVELPADPHLATGDVIDLDALAPATKDAVLELAATVADGFGSRTSGLASHGFRT